MGIRSTQPRQGLFGAGLILAVIAGLMLWGFVQVSGQAQSTVTADDSADLIDALEDVEDGEVTIQLTAADYELTSAFDGGNGLPVINGDVTIQGNGATIQRSSSSPFRILQVDSGGTLNLHDVTISGGAIFDEESGGGGIHNSGTLTLTNSTISGNLAFAGSGGGIFNSGTATLTNSTISDNNSMTDATEGDGGGIFNGGNLTLINSTVSGNEALRDGGGIFNGENLTLINSTVSGNKAGFDHNGGGIYNDGYLAVTNSIVWGNQGIDIGRNIDSVSHAIVGGGHSDCTSSDNCSDVDPRFVAPEPAASAPTTGGDYRLRVDSPAINAGDDDALPSGITTDLDGNPRVVGDEIDLGAYEAQFTNVELTLSADPNPALLNDEVTIDVEITGENLDTGILDGLEVDLTGLNGDETITLGGDGTGNLTYEADTVGSFELEASLGTLSHNLTLVVASAPELTVPDDVTIPEADAADYDLSAGVSATDWEGETLGVSCELQTGDNLEIGDNTIGCNTQDSLEQSASDTYVITVASVPTLTVPESFTVDYDQRDPVTWSTSATDWEDSNIDVTCDPASGSSFAVGETEVTCTTDEDELGQSASGSFEVTVLPEPEPEIPTISDLREAIDELDLNRGTENSLMAQLNAAERSLDRGNTNAACGQLGAFINGAGPRIGADAAADLIEMATRIRDELGC